MICRIFFFFLFEFAKKYILQSIDNIVLHSIQAINVWNKLNFTIVTSITLNLKKQI